MANVSPIYLALVACVINTWTPSCQGWALNTKINYLVPHFGSLNGGLRVTIYGSGFAKNQFNFMEDSVLGNRVVFVSLTSSYVCDIHKDGCTEIQLMCYTRPMPDNFYYARVFVDGEQVPDQNIKGGPFGYYVRLSTILWNSPRIRSFRPRTSLPGSMVHIEGKLFTDLYEANAEESSNGSPARITRSYMGGQTCELRDPFADDNYRLELDYDASDDTYSGFGHLSCLVKGTYVGNQNYSFIVDLYGRSLPSLTLLEVTATNHIAMYQTYAEVTGVSPSAGSVMGGTELTISGRYFDDTDAPIRVTMGGESCTVLEHSDQEIICRVGPKAQESGIYPGSRGVDQSVWLTPVNFWISFENFLKLNIPPDEVHHYDHFDWFEDIIAGRDQYITHFRSFFVPPSDNDYKFFIYGDDRSSLWLRYPGALKSIQIAWNPYARRRYKDPSQISERLTLSGGERYLLEVFHRENRYRAAIRVGVYMYQTPFTAVQAGNVLSEIQVLKSTSNNIKEHQIIRLTGWMSQTGADEVQVIDVITSAVTEAVFRLCMYGVCTEALRASESESVLKAAVDALPSIIPATVSVTAEYISDGRRFTVTIHSTRGDWPDFVCVQDATSLVPVSFSVVSTPGVASMDYFIVSLDGVPSTPLQWQGSDANDVKLALSKIFTVRCPLSLTTPRGRIFQQTHEKRTYYLESGTRVMDVEPFCGRYSSLGPKFVYERSGTMRAINIFSYPYLCFAYKGYLHQISIMIDQTWPNSVIQDMEMPQTTSWLYTCIDMAAKVQQEHPTLTSATLRAINLHTDGQYDTLLLDEIYIGSIQPTDDPEFTAYRRLAPKNWIGRDFTVVELQEDEFDVTFDLHNCAHDLPLFYIEHSQIWNGSHENATLFISDAWPAGASVYVSRLSAAAPPIEGTFSVSYADDTLTDIPVDMGARELRDQLEALSGMGKLSVTQTGDCHGYTWTIEWLTAGGDQPELVLETMDITGIDADMTVMTRQDGGVFFDPIPGDLLRTVHIQPQVSVTINDIPSLCSGDCSYHWSANATPTVSDVTPLSGSSLEGTILTITGTGFDPYISRSSVTIGGLACLGLQGSMEEIRCAIGKGPTGTYDVVVDVAQKGLAQHQGGTFQFTYNLAVYGIEPSYGAMGGGTRLTIQGYGFSENARVSINGNHCDYISIDFSRVVCLTPPSYKATSVPVVVQQGDVQNMSPHPFTYDQSVTPTVTELSTNVVTGGTVLTLTGLGFGVKSSSQFSVQIGDGTMMNVTSHTDTEIIVVVPYLSNGFYPLKVEVNEHGYGIYSPTQTLPEVEYQLVVHGVQPRVGSLYGGTHVTLTGAGFGSDAEYVEVTVGQTPCFPLSVEMSQIVCTVGNPAQDHLITNQGQHPVHGVGFSWSPQRLDIHVGDTVEWRWTTPDLVIGVGYLVERTTSASDHSYAGFGFQSAGGKTANGQYSYKFGSPGIYYYWSGPVESEGLLIMRGVLNVRERESTVSALTVKVASHEANYDLGGSPQSRPKTKRALSCSGVTGSVDGCSDSWTPSTSVTNFMFHFSECRVPTVIEIEPFSGSVLVNITVVGTGFGEENCQNEIHVGSYPCVAQSSSPTEIVCILDPLGDMPIGIPLTVQVVVNNRGSALINIDNEMDRRFVLLPHISEVSPSSGSMNGGTLLTISGGGFAEGATSVQVGGLSCEILVLSYVEIICETGSAWEMTVDLTVHVTAQGQQVPSVCAGVCSYSFTAADTPHVVDVTPREITTERQILTLTGVGFAAAVADISVLLGETECGVQSRTSTSITCDAGWPIAGEQPLVLKVTNKGYATVDVETISVHPDSFVLSIATGTLGGGTPLTITGFGFDSNSTVDIGDAPCDVVSVSVTSIECLTSPREAEDVEVIVQSNGFVYRAVPFKYNTCITPVLQQVSPTLGSEGDVITLTTTTMTVDADHVNILVGSTLCNLIAMETITVMALSTTDINCTLGMHPAGEYNITLYVQGLGLSVGLVTFTYDLEVTGLSPDTGSFGGGQVVTVIGRGFLAGATNVTICDLECQVVDVLSSTEVECETPEITGAAATTCDVTVSVGAVSASLLSEAPQDRRRRATSRGYVYDRSLTPVVSSVTPRRGGTGGGTPITVTGYGFGSIMEDLNITIAGTVCMVSSASDTGITCTTQAHKPSVTSNVLVGVGLLGNAKEATDGAAAFQYIDVWSSRFTWNDMDPPVAGDFVIIPADMTVLLDTSTPVLKILLIKGGKVVFDERDLELQAEVILITDGGVLQVGTEEQPFQHKAIITLHGHVKSKELPIYGTKCIAVREGILDLHGMSPGLTWTHLGQTAQRGDAVITLNTPVQWSIGDEIVIATTGLRHSQSQSEKRSIRAISSNGLTLTLDSPLDNQHLGESMTLTGEWRLEARAEVGLLTRNVVVRGSDNVQWHDVIEPCPEGFDTGEFAVQTCFQGRFGEQIGSDQFGGQIIMHAPHHRGELVVGRIENTELTYVGQAFRLGRYAIHFHMNGDMPSSYVRGCAIHRSFNRAVNIHHSNYITVEHTVLYNIMGGAFFTEDGIEIGNVFQYNLAVMVISSTSLQNDDITPAGFWVTNPNNIIRHNAVAGGTHFGFWYRMHDHPGGPSFDPDICPRKTPLGEFRNNTVHSCGWFGLWIFQHYYPMTGGACNSKIPTPARFYGLTAWNNNKGAEWVGGGAIQFHDFTIVHNEDTGIDMKLILYLGDTGFTEDGPMISNSIIAGSANRLFSAPTHRGLAMPYGQGLTIRDTTFMNFADNSHICFEGVDVQGKSGPNNGGFTYKTRGLTFVNADSKIYFRWHHEAVYHDLDGSLCGSPDCKVIPYNPSLPPTCSVTDNEFRVNWNIPGATCEGSVKFHRFSFNDPTPLSLLHKDVTFTSTYGTTFTPWAIQRITHNKGWMVLLASGLSYIMAFENAGQISDMTFKGTFYDLQNEDHVIMKHNFVLPPDEFRVLEGDDRPRSSGLLTSANLNGDWTFDPVTNTFSYIVTSKTVEMPTGSSTGSNTDIDYRTYSCASDCQSTTVEVTPPPDERPSTAVYWHGTAAWDGTEDGWGGNYGNGLYGIPTTGDNVKIPFGVWMVVTDPIPVLGQLWIYGTLEFEGGMRIDDTYREYVLSATHIVIAGGHLIVGWEDQPFQGLMDIVLLGDHQTPAITLPYGPNLGAKALGVFGGLDLHGSHRATSWTQINAPAHEGASNITLVQAVDWSVGDEVVIAPTGFDLEETEVKVIAWVSEDGMTLTLDSVLEHEHIMSVEQISATRTYTMAAEVGLLSRNIRVIGGDYSQLQAQAFGARVLVGTFYDEPKLYTGYARLSDVEFYHSGQEGWTDRDDPRHSLAFLNVGDVTEMHPSYVKSCSFHHGFSPAIGVFGTNFLPISDNVVHHTVGSGIIVAGMSNSVKRNLVVHVIHPGVFQDRNESRLSWEGGIELVEPNPVLPHVLQGNTVAGSHRALYQVDGEACSKLDVPNSDMWDDNLGHSALIGVIMWSHNGLLPCTLLANFTIYRTYDYGIYTQTYASVKVVNYVSIDNQVGLYPMVARPSSRFHEYEDKFYHVIDSIFVGHSSAYGCNEELTGDNLLLTKMGRSWKTPSGGRIGLSWPTFVSSANHAPVKEFHTVADYQAINGVLKLIGVTFSRYKTSCGGQRDYLVMPNPKNEDVQHPIVTNDITLYDVLPENLAYISRASLAKINPSNCVDMECDGLKKAIVYDTDGTFLGMGSSGGIIPESEWAWDQDPRRGIGDYRIPATLLTNQDGNRIPVEDIAPYKGIVRDEKNCTYKPDYQAYVCHGLAYFLLHLENMDADTETRRVSPVAVLSDGYLDLINGPQDHGWCMGYTCQKRLSMFPVIVTSDKEYEIHYTGTTPQSMRFHFLNSDDSHAIVLATYYGQSYRLNVYVEGIYKPPTNGDMSTGQLVLSPLTIKPNLATDPTGTNYFDPRTLTLYVLLRGSTPVDIRTDPMVVVTFNVVKMSVDEFFGENIINNLAQFYGISADRIKYAAAVSETRRRRQGYFSFSIEISNPPCNLGQQLASDISIDTINGVCSSIVDNFQLGTLGNILNLTISSMAVLEPPPDPAKVDLNYLMESKSNQPLQSPKRIVMVGEIPAIYENDTFRPFPKFNMLDAEDETVKRVGSVLKPWEVSVTMVTNVNQDARLVGTLTAPFHGHCATFKDLSITHSGIYQLHFDITHPEHTDFSTFVYDVIILAAPEEKGPPNKGATQPTDSPQVDEDYENSGDYYYYYYNYFSGDYAQPEPGDGDTGVVGKTETPETSSRIPVIPSTTVTQPTVDYVLSESTSSVGSTTPAPTRSTQDDQNNNGWPNRTRPWTRNPNSNQGKGNTWTFTRTTATPNVDQINIMQNGLNRFSAYNNSLGGSGPRNLETKSPPDNHGNSPPSEHRSNDTDLSDTPWDRENSFTRAVRLRFLGDFKQIVAGSEREVISALLQYLLHRYPQVAFTNFHITEGRTGILANFYVFGSKDYVTLTIDDMWNHVTSLMAVRYGDYVLVADKEMTVDGKPFYGSLSASSSQSQCHLEKRRILLIVMLLHFVCL